MLPRENWITEDENGVPLKNIRLEIPARLSKNKKARTTYLSIEASNMVRPMLKGLADGKNPFTKQSDRRNFISSIEKVLIRALVKANLDQRYEENGQYRINTHSFRAYGITKMSRHDSNLAKFLAGQKGYLLQYDRLDNDEKLEIYKEHEIDFIIDHDAIQKAEIEKLTEEKIGLAKEVQRIATQAALKVLDDRDKLEKSKN